MNSSQVTAEITIQESEHLHMWRRMSLNRQSMRTCIVAGLIGIAVVLTISISGGADAYEIATVLFVGVVAMIVLFWAFYLTLPRRARKVYSQTASLGEKQEYRLDEECVSISQVSGNARVKWTNLHMWDEDSHVLLMYLNSMQAFLIPKSQVDQEFIDFAKSRLVNNGLPSKGTPRK